MWIPKQFHFPQSASPTPAMPTYRLVKTDPTWVEYCSSTTSRSNRQSRGCIVEYGHNFEQNDLRVSMPTIKCSLCKSSTPTKQNDNQFGSGDNDDDDDNNKTFNESDLYESIMVGDMSNISSYSSDSTVWPALVQSHGDHCENRFVVRIFTQSK